MVELDAYFARIGYDGPREPTLETLRALQRLHPASIPFEAIDVMLGRGISLDPADIDAKLIAGGRGGYCFEQNNLFRRVLTALGFDVEPLLARVVWMRQPDQPPGARTHMVLRVTLDGAPWIADVGFGAAVLTGPLRLDLDEPQETPHDTYRLVDSAEGRRLEMRLPDAWAPVYEISLAPQTEADFEMGNWFTATHPASHFRHNLMVARSTPEGRFGLLHNRLTIRRPGGAGERRLLDRDELEEALRSVFGLPVQPDWRPALERAVAAGGG